MAKKTNSNFQPIFDYIDQRISDSETKILERLDERTSNLPTKKEYFETMDALMIELRGAREDLAAHKVSHETMDEDTTGLKKNVNNLYEELKFDQPVAQPAI